MSSKPLPLPPKPRIRMLWRDTSAAAVEIISAPPHKKGKKEKNLIYVLPQFPDEIWLHIFQYIPKLKSMVHCILTSKPETNDLARFARNFVVYKATKIIENTLGTMAKYLDLKKLTLSDIDNRCMIAVVKFAKVQCQEKMIFWLSQYFKLCFPRTSSFITASTAAQGQRITPRGIYHHVMLYFYPLDNLVEIDCHCEKIGFKGQGLSICCQAMKAADVLVKLFRALKIKISVTGTLEPFGFPCHTQALISSLKEEQPVYCYETNQWKRKCPDYPQPSASQQQQQIFSNPILSYSFL